MAETNTAHNFFGTPIRINVFIFRTIKKHFFKLAHICVTKVYVQDTTRLEIDQKRLSRICDDDFCQKPLCHTYVTTCSEQVKIRREKVDGNVVCVSLPTV